MPTFKNEQELLNFLIPVLKMRTKSLLKEDKNLTQEELYQYLKQTVWIHQKDLHIYQMVDDILNTDVNRRK